MAGPYVKVLVNFLRVLIIEKKVHESGLSGPCFALDPIYTVLIFEPFGKAIPLSKSSRVFVEYPAESMLMDIFDLLLSNLVFWEEQASENCLVLLLGLN